MGSREGLDVGEKSLSLTGNRIPDLRSSSPYVSLSLHRAIPAPEISVSREYSYMEYTSKGLAYLWIETMQVSHS
jgi:hypothetical protein